MPEPEKPQPPKKLQKLSFFETDLLRLATAQMNMFDQFIHHMCSQYIVRHGHNPMICGVDQTLEWIVEIPVEQRAQAIENAAKEQIERDKAKANPAGLTVVNGVEEEPAQAS